MITSRWNQRLLADATERRADASSAGRAFGAILLIIGLAVLAIAGWRMFDGEPAGETPLAAAFLIMAAGMIAARQTSAQDLPDAR